MTAELEHLFNLSIDMLGVVSAGGVLINANPAWERVLGYPLDQMIGQPVTHHILELDAAHTHEAFARLQQAQGAIRFENRYRAYDGTLRWLTWNAVADMPKGLMYCVVRDETQHKITEMQLTLRNRAIESSPMGVTIADMTLPDQPLIYINTAFERITGYSPLDVIGRNCRFLQGNDREQPALVAIRAALRDQRAVTVVLRNYRKNGEMFFNELSLAPIQDEKGRLTHFIGICNDVTKRILAEEKISTQNEELIIANYNLALARKEAEDATRLKSQFLATMSHELRTPLNAIIGYTEIQLAGMAGTLTNEQRDYQERVLANADHLLGLINDVLDLSKIEAGRMELVSKPFSLPQWLEEIVAQTQALAIDKSLGYITELDPRMPEWIVGDPARLKQVAINLLSNAFKFTDQGHVRIQIRKHGRDAWQLNIEDTGIGIASHMQETIFEEFRQVDSSSARKQGGTGLGLSIVRKLCLMMGGNVRVKSKLGKGSIFTVTLPLEVPELASSSRDGGKHVD
jgi:PAS domain S-box-containing protein